MRKRVGTCLGVPLKQDNQGHPLERPEVLRPARQAVEKVNRMKIGPSKRVRCAIYM